MRTLDEIYFELKNHPDCIQLEIIDKDRIVEDVRDAIEWLHDGILDEDEKDELAEQWFEEHRQILKLRFTNFYEQEDENWLLLYSKIEEWLENKK
jgi:hypothetical protein